MYFLWSRRETTPRESCCAPMLSQCFFPSILRETNQGRPPFKAHAIDSNTVLVTMPVLTLRYAHKTCSALSHPHVPSASCLIHGDKKHASNSQQLPKCDGMYFRVFLPIHVCGGAEGAFDPCSVGPQTLMACLYRFRRDPSYHLRCRYLRLQKIN